MAFTTDRATDTFRLDLNPLESELTQPQIVELGKGLSFARTQIEACGIDIGSRPVVVCQNFVVDSSAMQPLSDPLGDVYLGFLGIGSSAAGDTILTLRTLPGLLDEYHRIGLLSPESKVFEVDPVLDSVVTGYPFTSPLELVARNPASKEHFMQLFAGKERPIFIGTFLTEHMRQLVNSLECDYVQVAEPGVTNNKFLFGQKSSEYGFTVMPQVRIDSEANFKEAAQIALAGFQVRERRGDEFGERVTVAWLKLSGGSGGDFVQKIEIAWSDLNSSSSEVAVERSMRDAFQRLRGSVEEAFTHNQYGEGALEKYWPSESFGPNGSAVIVEQDARVRGAVRVNASNLMIIHEDGSWSVEGFFKQITGREGDYRGSMPFSPAEEFSSEFMQELETNMAAVARFAHDHNLRGYIGIDFFITESAPGVYHAAMTEMNGRIPISGAARIMADKLGAPAWVNVNLDLPEQITSYADFARQLGEFADFHPGDFSQCRVIPQAFRTLCNEKEVVTSSRLKALIVGPTQEACLNLMNHLNESGHGK